MTGRFTEHYFGEGRKGRARGRKKHLPSRDCEDGKGDAAEKSQWLGTGRHGGRIQETAKGDS